MPVHINCQIDNTKFAITLPYDILPVSLPAICPPASGTSFKQVFDAIARILIKEEWKFSLSRLTMRIICSMKTRSTRFSTPCSLVPTRPYEGTRIGVIRDCE